MATKAEAERLRDRAIALRAKGKSWSEIAAAVGYKDPSGAQRAVTRAKAKKKTKRP